MNIEKIYNQKTSVYKESLNFYIAKYIELNKKILDVGCASGKLGAYLKKEKNAIVVGVDISKIAIDQATKVLDETYCLNIEKDNLPFVKNSFDIIICVDILEHLFNPRKTLKKLKHYLKNDGYFVLSIPNIANIEIRLNLLLGKFNYQRTGILDNTHIKFFTQKTAKGLVQSAGLKILKIDYTPGFSFFFLRHKYIKNSPFLQKIKYFLCKIWPTLLCCQFIIIAKKND